MGHDVTSDHGQRQSCDEVRTDHPRSERLGRDGAGSLRARGDQACRAVQEGERATTTMKKSKSGVEEGKGGASASQEIDARIKELNDWRGETLARIRMLIKQADPEVVEEVKWRKPSNSMLGVPVWSHAGIICTGETYKNVVKLTFAKGASLPDPSRLFNSSLEGNTRRAIDIHEGEQVNAGAFQALVKAAVAQNGPQAPSPLPRRVGPAALRRAGPPSSTVNIDGGPALEASLSHPY